jgi:hypothetical protein
MLIVFLLGNVNGCDDEECAKTKAPEINFAFLLGGKIFITDHNYEKNITTQFENVNMMVNKAYCNGEIRGPFEQNYLITTDGILVRQAIGTWSFRMDNTKDHMNVNIFCEGHDMGTYNIYYDDLKQYDQGTAYFEFGINTAWDANAEIFINTVLTVR